MTSLEKVREALTWVEEWFTQNVDNGGYHGCPWCYGHNDDDQGEPASWKNLKHSNDCLIGQALAGIEADNPSIDVVNIVRTIRSWYPEPGIATHTYLLTETEATTKIQQFSETQLSKERERANGAIAYTVKWMIRHVDTEALGPNNAEQLLLW